MARHRNIRTLNYDDVFTDIEGYGSDEYASSFENGCITPETENMYMYARERHNSVSKIWEPQNPPVKEEDEDHLPDVDNRGDPVDRGKISIVDQEKLFNCLEDMRNVVGDSVPDALLSEAAISGNFNPERALNALFERNNSPKKATVQPLADTDDILGDNNAPGPGLDLRQLLNDDTEKVDVLGKLMEDVESHEKPQIFSRSSTKTASATRTIIRHLQRRDDRVLKGIFDWYKQLLSVQQRFSFESLSPDDVVRIAKQQKVVVEAHKAHGSQTKPKDSNQRKLQTEPIFETPYRITFNGKDSGRKNDGKVKPATARAPKVEKEQPTKKVLAATMDATTTSKPVTVSKVDPKAIEEQYERERNPGKPLLNLVVVGHVDAGKSTLMGHLLFLTGNVSKKTMSKYEHESKKIHKASFAYAWVLDETTEERSRGITMDMAYAKLITANRCLNILDAPGHKDFIPNMITGAAQADVAILVVDASRGEFETGFQLGGQTREHTMLVRSLGVTQLSVCVNKLDTCEWSEKRFNEIVATLKPFLKQTGFADAMVSYVPCSGLSGVNLHERSQLPELTKWYNGPCLLETVDKMKPPERPITKPLRMCVFDVFRGIQSGVCVSGKIESGSMAQGDKLLIMPAQEPCVVRALQIDDLPYRRAFAGDTLIVNLDKCDPMHIVPGSVLCDPDEPIRSVSKFEAKVVIFDVDVPIIKGSSVVLHFQSLNEPAFFGKLVKEINKITGEVVRERPRFLSKNSSGVVVIKVARPICIELYQDSKDLGRITLRQGGHTVAAGVVTALL